MSNPFDYKAGDLFVFSPADGFSTACAFEQGNLGYYFERGDIIVFLQDVKRKQGMFENQCEILTSRGIANMYQDELDNEFIPLSLEARLAEREIQREKNTTGS